MKYAWILMFFLNTQIFPTQLFRIYFDSAEQISDREFRFDLMIEPIIPFNLNAYQCALKFNDIGIDSFSYIPGSGETLIPEYAVGITDNRLSFATGVGDDLIDQVKKIGRFSIKRNTPFNFIIPSLIWDSSMTIIVGNGFGDLSGAGIYDSLDYNVPLPVELISFTASQIGNEIHLVWRMAAELNNLGYLIERSQDSAPFDSLIFISGSGVSNSEMTYTYADKLFSGKRIHYRLTQIDFDGTKTILNSIYVDITLSEYTLSQNYPNPFNPVTRISFSIPSDSDTKLSVFNALGERIAIFDEFRKAGFYNVDIDLSGYPSGVYFYSLQSNDFSETKKMILQK